MDLYVGQSALRGEFARYARKLNFLELIAEPSLLPKVAKLAAYRQAAPEFTFSVVLTPRCFSSNPVDAARALEYSLGVVAALKPRWVVLRTPPALHPGPAGLRQVEQLLERIPKGDYKIAWEARGLWESTGLRQAAASLGVTPVLDLADAAHFGDVPLTECCYARLLAIGTAQRPSEGLLLRFLEKVLLCNEVFVVADGGAAGPIKQSLETLLEDLASDEEEEDEDDEDTDEDAADDDQEGPRGEEEE